MEPKSGIQNAIDMPFIYFCFLLLALQLSPHCCATTERPYYPLGKLRTENIFKTCFTHALLSSIRQVFLSISILLQV